MSKSGLIACIFIALIPSNWIRIFCYRILLGYEISCRSKIGFGTILHVRHCVINDSHIGILNRISCESLELNCAVIKKMNVIRKIDSFVMSHGAVIVSHNYFVGTTLPNILMADFFLGKNSVITSNHYFDLVNHIRVGDNVVIGGSQTQIWTHGFDINRNMISAPVVLQDNIYIGSRCLLCLGVEIASNVSIGAGTCVSRSITESGFYVSQYLIRKSDVQDFNNDDRLVGH